MKCSLGINLIFLKKSLVFPILLFYSISFTDHQERLSYLSLLFFGTLCSNGYIFPFLLCLSLLFFFQLFLRPPQATILSFCISFSWGCSWYLPPVQCHEPPSRALHALSDLIPWIYLLLPLYNHKRFGLDHTEWSSGFLYFLQYKSEFCNEFMIWATVSSQSCFLLMI